MHNSCKRLLVTLMALSLLLAATAANAGHGNENGTAKKAIVLTAFGTSYPEAITSILAIQKAVQKAFPNVPVKLAFTSNIIRNIWIERSQDKAWQKANPGVPAEVLHVKTPLATIADLQNKGYRDITVQSLHVFAGEEFHDTVTLLAGLRSIRALKPRHTPFARLALGRPALGMPGEGHPYKTDLTVAAKTLKTDVEQARKMDAALVYMGHGNDFFSTGIYAEFQSTLQQEYGWPVIIGCVEGFPGFDEALTALKATGKKSVLMKPLMIVAGDHASNDMAGAEDDSWKVMLTKEGFDVHTELRGLGVVPEWAQLYVAHLKDAMAR